MYIVGAAWNRFKKWGSKDHTEESATGCPVPRLTLVGPLKRRSFFSAAVYLKRRTNVLSLSRRSHCEKSHADLYGLALMSPSYDREAISKSHTGSFKLLIHKVAMSNATIETERKRERNLKRYAENIKYLIKHVDKINSSKTFFALLLFSEIT